jgi:putative endopeptidase
MKLKYTNLMLMGALCLSATTFAANGDKPVKGKAQSKTQSTPPRKFIDPANMDLSVKPGDDFFDYANGNWIKQNAIPAKETRWGSFNILRQENTDRL